MPSVIDHTGTEPSSSKRGREGRSARNVQTPKYGSSRSKLEVPEFADRLVAINRVSKTVKGGKRFGFAALVVVGDQRGRVGFGKGKAKEVPEAIRKATEQAKSSLISVPLKDGRTLHHDIKGRHGAGKVVIRSAVAGTGIIAGGPMRAVFEMLGLQDVVAKSTGSRNPYNMVRATIDGLKKEESVRHVAMRRAMAMQHIKASMRAEAGAVATVGHNSRFAEQSSIKEEIVKLRRWADILETELGKTVRSPLTSFAEYFTELNLDAAASTTELREEIRRFPKIVWDVLLRSLAEPSISELAAKCLVLLSLPQKYRGRSSLNDNQMAPDFCTLLEKTKNTAFIKTRLHPSKNGTYEVSATVIRKPPFTINGRSVQFPPNPLNTDLEYPHVLGLALAEGSVDVTDQLTSEESLTVTGKLRFTDAELARGLVLHVTVDGRLLSTRVIERVGLTAGVSPPKKR